MALFGSSFAALKVSFEYYHPMVIIFGRMVVASMGFMLLIPRMGKVARPSRRDLRLMLLMTIAEPGLYFVFETKALQYTTASQAGMVMALMPVLVAVGAAIFLKERLSARLIFGFFLGMVGVVVLSVGASADEWAPNPVLGNFYEFLAIITATVYTLCLKHLLTRYRPLLLASLQAFGGVIFFLPFLFFPGTELPTEFHPWGAFWIIYLGLFVTLGAYSLWAWGFTYVSASHGALFTNFIPAFTLLIGWAFLGETLSWPQILAVMIIFAGVIISQRGRRVRPRAA